ncbi:MAG: 50S ribosomal protein L11 [Bacteroidota bacterium]
MAKKITGYIKLQIPPGAANPSPPVGPALGQKGVNIMEFCKSYNAATQEQQKQFPGMKLPVVITVYADKSFSFITKLPPVPQLVRKESGVKQGSKETGKVFVGTIKKSQIRKIAEMKMQDMNANTIEAAMQMVAGTAMSMGIEVKEG